MNIAMAVMLMAAAAIGVSSAIPRYAPPDLSLALTAP